MSTRQPDSPVGFKRQLTGQEKFTSRSHLHHLCITLVSSAPWLVMTLVQTSGVDRQGVPEILRRKLPRSGHAPSALNKH